MITPTPNRRQHSLQRWIVRRGPLFACLAITAVVAAKILLPILDILGWPAAYTDFAGVFETLDRMPWPIAIFILLASWMTFFLGVPLWRRYLAFIDRRRVRDEEENGEGGSLMQSSKGARQKRLH